ncbi:hypothetical protein QCD85_06410 [Paenibacillus sp. PsM32]|uniref:hypothetical protein n=1 Tax=Paenibacillus sp. PsM32 TaxID=3030536 RepID=UPI00263A8D22|nr:hypothetical protein [Paenibacillus sp. PsM32]MDN4617722.1 hypothetical protein [Paenibacillus sp. PsM32]
MNNHSSNHHSHKMKWLRNAIVSVAVIGLLGSVFTIGSRQSEATIQSTSTSNYHNSYFVIGNPKLVIAVVAGASVGMGVGMPFTAKLYTNMLSSIK